MFLEEDMSSPSLEPIVQHRVVRAGAGAGKTTRLVAEVINRARDHKKQNGVFPRMVLTTFTRKATQEIRERLILKACEQDDVELLEYLSSPSFLQVSTIHGVLSLFLRRYGHLTGLDNGFTFLSDIEAHRWAQKLVRDLCLSDPKAAELVGQLSVKRVAEICRFLSHRFLESEEVRPPDIDDLTEMAQHHWMGVTNEVQPVLEKLKAQTSDLKFLEFGKVLEQILKDLQNLSGDIEKQLELCRQRIPKKPPINRKTQNISEDLNEELDKSLKYLKENLERVEFKSSHWPEHLGVLSQLQSFAQVFHQEFFKLKKSKGAFEMVDLESLSFHILKSHPGIAQAFASDFDYWLIDEFQDTSPLQTDLLKLLIGSRPTFVVGDPQQSIYLFRGARSEVFAEHERQIESQGGKLETLDQNWRSEPELLEFFNDVFSSLSRDFSRMRPRAPVQDPSKIVARLCPTTQEDRLKVISAQVETWLKEGAQPEEIAILAKTNRELAFIARDLSLKGFPTHLHVASGFFERREIMDAMALLKFLVHPFDNENLILLLRSPWCKVPDAEIISRLESRKTSFWEQISQLPHPVISRLIQLRESTRTVGITATFEEALREFGWIDFSKHHDVTGRRESNLWKLLHLLKTEEKQPGFSFLKFIDQQLGGGDTDTGSEEADAIASLEPHHIQLMTIHSSKGLQFRHVLLPNLEKKMRSGRRPPQQIDRTRHMWTASLPLGENSDNLGTLLDLKLTREKQAAEEKEFLRVFYVALTRAQHSVCLVWSDPAEKGSWLEKLPMSLEPGRHQTAHYSYEVLQSSGQVGKYSKVSEIETPVRPLYQSNLAGAKRKISVTELILEQSAVEIERSAIPASRVTEGIKKTHEGVMIHKMMETLHSHWDFNFQSVAQEWFGARAAEILSAVDWVKALQEVPMKSLIQSGHVEWGYQLKENGHIVEGQIDLWGEVNGQCWIVDYKSGSQKYEEQAMDQLTHYAKAVSHLTTASEIKICVIYPLERVVKTRTVPCPKKT